MREIRGERITETVARLTVQGEALAAAIAACKNARRRLLLLEMLSDGGQYPLSEISKLVKDARTGLNDLCKRGYAELIEREMLRSPYPDTLLQAPDPELTEEQRQVLLPPPMPRRRLLPGTQRSAPTTAFFSFWILLCVIFAEP